MFPRAALVGLGAGLVVALFPSNAKRGRRIAESNVDLVTLLPGLWLDLSDAL